MANAKTAREALATLAPPDPSALDRIEAAAVTLDTSGEPPPRRAWLAGDDSMGWLPAGRLALLTGEGGAGKSRLALQLAAAVAGGGRDVLPSARPGERADEDEGPVVASGEPRPVAVIGFEDEADEAGRRLRWIEAAGIAAAAKTGDRPRYLDAAAFGPLWAADNRYEPGDWTPFGLAALEWLASIEGLALAVLDPLAAVYGGNENDRGEVRRFLATLNAWAAETGVAVLVVAHPPKTGASYSGSTDWRNGVRALWTLTTEAVGGYEKPGDGEAGARGRCLTLDKGFWTRSPLRGNPPIHASSGPPPTSTGTRCTTRRWTACGGKGSAALGTKSPNPPATGAPCRRASPTTPGPSGRSASTIRTATTTTASSISAPPRLIATGAEMCPTTESRRSRGGSPRSSWT
ncbi:MAG: AAA family ATPase [Gemmatimonadota bacterium]|nr:AAA family ATPase [Gemmatimonadota bacterium]